MSRLRKNPLAQKELAIYPFVFDWKLVKDNLELDKIFNNNNDFYLEIGMGKGDFIIEHALLSPPKNFLGIEKFQTVQLIAAKKITNLIPNLDNLKLVSADVSDFLPEIKNNLIAGIYLNFSDPWPKIRHAKRRLMDLSFLTQYNRILKSGGFIEFKTDQLSLFEFALEQINLSKQFNLVKIDYDLHQKQAQEIIKTEYEKKFLADNIKINFLKIEKI
ncbi:MAG: tRNA (guanosine(46)-N7)-methyltransferase TrmB [Mycoplasmataceae bacterium]|nr:tRNA (guanosine(46)-N7)-methyltransferase TrmB [Mycoplasmataceae bacterium]